MGNGEENTSVQVFLLQAMHGISVVIVF